MEGDHRSLSANATDEDAVEVPYGYQWPASRLSYENMRRLTILSNRVKRPINQLIKEAVEAYATELLENDDAGSLTRHKKTGDPGAMGSPANVTLHPKMKAGQKEV